MALIVLANRIKFAINLLKNFPLLNISVGFCLGVIGEEILGVDSFIDFFLCLWGFGLVIFCITYRRFGTYFKVFMLSFLFIFLGGLRVSFLEYSESSKEMVSTLNGSLVYVIGVINREVERDGLRVSFVIKPTNISTVECKNISTGRRDCHSTGKPYGYVLVRLRGSVPVRFGDKIQVEGLLKEPEDFQSFSYKEFLRAQGIYSILEGKEVDVISRRNGNLVLLMLKDLNDYISGKIEAVLPRPHSSLLSGIVYGAKNTMSDEFSSNLSRTGTTHIIAVSGYNITVLISTFGVFTPLLGRRKLVLYSIFFIILFMFFIGIDNIPVVRASIMGIVFLISQLLGRKRCVLSLFPLTVAVLLFANPLVFKLLSFQLSFLSTLGLILLTERIEKRISFIPEFLREDVASTFAAIFFTLPITISNFGQVSLVAPLVNFLVLPIVPLVTIYGILLILGLIVAFPIAKIASWFIWLFLEYMIRVILFFGSMEFAMVRLNDLLSTYLGNLLSLLLCLISYELIFQKYNKNKKRF